MEKVENPRTIINDSFYRKRCLSVVLIPCIHQYYPKGGWVFRFASRRCIWHPADNVTAEGGQNPRSGARWEPPNSPPPWSTKCSLGAVGHRETMQETESPLWWAAEPLGPRYQGSSFFKEEVPRKIMMRARQSARAADRYGTSMRFHIVAKEEKGTLIKYAWFHVNVIAQSPATMIWNLSKNLVITR